MSNQEAIALLRNLEDALGSYCELNEEGKTAFCMAIEALSCSEFPNSSDCISRQAAIDMLKNRWKKTRNYEGIGDDIAEECELYLKQVPSAQPQTEWNNHTVACLLAELFGDACACNYNGIDEWLPEKCEVIDACPNPVGVACWEQFLTHRAERRTDANNNLHV